MDEVSRVSHNLRSVGRKVELGDGVLDSFLCRIADNRIIRFTVLAGLASSDIVIKNGHLEGARARTSASELVQRLTGG